MVSLSSTHDSLDGICVVLTALWFSWSNAGVEPMGPQGLRSDHRTLRDGHPILALINAGLDPGATRVFMPGSRPKATCMSHASFADEGSDLLRTLRVYGKRPWGSKPHEACFPWPLLSRLACGQTRPKFRWTTTAYGNDGSNVLVRHDFGA